MDPVSGTRDERSAQVLRRFRVVFNAVRSHFQQVERQVGLGGAQVWALSVIRDQPGIGPGGVAREMDIHQSTASNLIKGLLRRGLIGMARDPRDRRAARLTILPPGDDLLAQVSGPFEGVLPMALSRLPPERLQRLDEDLAALIGVLQEASHADESAGGIPLSEL